MVIVFGSINVDFIGQVTTLPKAGETVLGSKLMVAPGGKGANQALAARRAGAQVQLVGSVGNDDLAQTALSLLREAGVDLTSVAIDTEHTGCALILVDQLGENSIAVLPGANGAARADQLRTLRLEGGDVLVLQHEVPADEVRAAAAHAHRRGAHVILNSAPFLPVDRALFESVSVLVANENEAIALASHLFEQRLEEEAAMSLLAKQLNLTGILTLGARGAVAFNSDTVARVAALPIVPVDTVGAGDTFVGVLAASIEAGKPLSSAMRHAAVAASLACTVRGAQPAMPSSDMIARALMNVLSEEGADQ
jgi:ribokinase